MKALVTGGRDYVDNGSLWLTLDFIRGFAMTAVKLDGSPGEGLIIIHGACGWDLAEDGPPRPFDSAFYNRLTGADARAHLYALTYRLEVRCYPADWSQGTAGGPRRNQHMFHVEQPHVVVATPGGRGTAGMTEIARNAGCMVLAVTPWRRPFG